MSEDRGIYADIISNDIGGILASIEGEIYGPGVPSLDPGLSAGDSVPVAFILPNSSRQPLLVPRRPLLKEISQGVWDHFMKYLPTFPGFAQWIQAEGSWGCPSGITLTGAATVWDSSKIVSWGYVNRYPSLIGSNVGYQTSTLADCNDVTGLVAFDQAGSLRVGALWALWDGQPADGYNATGLAPVTTATDVVIREYNSAGTYTNYSLAPLMAKQQKSGSGLISTVAGQRNRRGGWLFIDLLSDTTGVYVACLQDGFYFLRRSDHHVFRASYPADVSRVSPTTDPADGSAATLLPTALRTGSHCMFGAWILDCSYDLYDNSASINADWSNTNQVKPNHTNRGQVWSSIRASDFTMNHQSIDLKQLVPNLVRSMGCGIQVSLWNNLPATRFPILWDELSNPAAPRHEAILWFCGIDNSWNSHIVLARIELSDRTLTTIEDRVAPMSFPLQYPGIISDALGWWTSECNSSRVPYRSGLDDQALSLNPANSAGYTSASLLVNADSDCLVGGPNNGQKISNTSLPANHYLTAHGNTVGEDCHDNSIYRGFDFGGYDSSALVKSSQTATFCLPHPLPGDVTEDDIANLQSDAYSGALPGTLTPGSIYSPSGVVGAQQNHYLIHSEADYMITSTALGSPVSAHTAPFDPSVPGSFPPIPAGAINVILLPFGIGTDIYAYTLCRAYSGGGTIWTKGQVNLIPQTKLVYTTWLTKRNLDNSIAWRIDITDYYSWAGVTGTTSQWVTIPAPAYPHLTCRWQYEEVGGYVFVLAQHAWAAGESLVSIRPISGPGVLTARDPYLDIYQASDGMLVGRINLRIPTDVPARAYSLWINPAYLDGYPPRMRCLKNSLGQSVAEINMAWRPNTGDGGYGTTGDVWSRTVIAWGSTSPTTSGVISRTDVAYGADNASGFLSVGYPIQSDTENRAITQSYGSFWLGPKAGQGDTLYQQPKPV